MCQVYYYAHSLLPVCDKVINDTLIMTLAWQCNTITTTFCLYRKFHHVLLQNHSCISSDRLDFSHPDVFQSQLHQTLHNIWHWSFSRSCSTEPGAWNLPSSTISATGLPTGEQTPSTGAEFLVPPHASISVFKFITIVSEGQWFGSSKPLLVPAFCRN